MKRTLRVFVVDDRPMIAYSLRAVLSDCGHRVIPYTNPAQALSDAGGIAPDVLISDIEMPVLNGINLAIEIQTKHPDCKVFLMSGHTGYIDGLESARKKGFQFLFFAKPVSAQTFVEQIERLSVTNNHPRFESANEAAQLQ